MRALVVDDFDPPGTGIRLTDIDRPVPASGQILVRMRLAPVNPSDLNHIRGTYHASPAEVIWNRDGGPVTFDPARTQPCPVPPLVLGGEGVGVVEAAEGGRLARRLVGKRVAIAANPFGTWAEYSVTDARRVVVLPAAVPDAQAAMFFVSPLTAWIPTHEVLRVGHDGYRLITTAGSALGRMVLQLAAEAGWRTIAVVRRGKVAAELVAAGATHVISTATMPLIDEVRRFTDGRGSAGRSTASADHSPPTLWPASALAAIW